MFFIDLGTTAFPDLLKYCKYYIDLVRVSVLGIFYQNDKF